MGCSQSDTYQGTGPRLPTSSISKCVILLTPPSFNISKFLKGFSAGFDYKYVSVGKLIREEINKNTQYSQVILENLEKDKYVNKTILEILLKNIIFQGNFMIQFCPKKEELDVWKRFIKMVDMRLVAIVNPAQVQANVLSKANYPQKTKDFEMQKQRLMSMFSRDIILQIEDGQSQQLIEQRLKKE